MRAMIFDGGGETRVVDGQHLIDAKTLYEDHPFHDPVKRTLSPHTIASRVRSMKRLFNWLEEEGEIDENPADRIRTPSPRRKKPKAISKQDFLALYKSTGDDVAGIRDRAILLCLADTGCRVGGLCGLTVEDVDLEQRLLTVTEKGDKTRHAPFTEPTAQALRDWLEVRPRDRGPALFVSLARGEGGALTRSGVAQMLQRRGKQAGVKGPHNAHSFRHFFAREFLLDGGDLATLADLMGHSSVEVTKHNYAIFKMEELKRKHDEHSPIKGILDE